MHELARESHNQDDEEGYKHDCTAEMGPHVDALIVASAEGLDHLAAGVVVNPVPRDYKLVVPCKFRRVCHLSNIGLQLPLGVVPGLR